MIRFGIVGCGRMGLRRAKIIEKHPRAKLVGVSDVNEKILKKTQELVIAETWTTNYEDLFDKVDVIIVCTPNKYHADIAISALEAGKHVFVEKPLARNPEEARKMVQSAEENGMTLKVSSNFRYFPNVQKARELLPKIGEILFMRGWIGHDGSKLTPWFRDYEMMGGGTMLDNGCHILDLALWFMGKPVECWGYVNKQPIEEIGIGLFKFENGSIATLQSSWREWQEYAYVEVYGTDGYIIIDSKIPNCLVWVSTKEGFKRCYDYSHLPPQSYEMEFNSYMNFLENNLNPFPSGYDGMKVVEMVHAVYESARTGRVVRL